MSIVVKLSCGFVVDTKVAVNRVQQECEQKGKISRLSRERCENDEIRTKELTENVSQGVSTAISSIIAKKS